MNVHSRKILNTLSATLIGFNLGFCLALLMAQWTWLELRFNTGLFILLGLLFGFIYGWVRRLKHSLIWGVTSITAFMLIALVISRGLENMQILLGSMFREGILIPSLSLNMSSLMIAGIACLTVLVAWRLNCLHG